MRALSIFRLRLRSVFARHKVEQELEEELRYHLERAIDEGLAAGLTPAGARHAALCSIQSIEQRKEECRDTRGLSLMDNLAQDVRYAVRQLIQNPVFALAAIVTLSLGICANLSIFAFIDAALIQPLPYRDQSRLVAVYEGSPVFPDSLATFQDFRDWQKLNKVFDSLEAYGGSAGWSFTLTTPAGAQQVAGVNVTAGFFRTLGVTPLLGRDFRPGEDLPAAPHTVLLSYAEWQKRFGGKRNVLGQAVTLDGVPNIIIGVLPPKFTFAPAGPAAFWATLRGNRECELSRGCHSVGAIARLKPAVSVKAALANIDSIAHQLARAYPADSDADQGADVKPLRVVIAGDLRPILLILQIGSDLLLLIASINVASLLLARSDSRRREIAVRSALGASSARLFHQFATESVVLVTIASLLGLILAQWTMRSLATLIPADMLDSIPNLHDLGLNQNMLAFACLIALAVAVLFTLTPVARLSLSQMLVGLKDGSRGSTGGTWRRFGTHLVAIELALAMVLLVSAGLLGKSLYLLLQVNTGLNAERLATLQLEPPASYAKDHRIVALKNQVVNAAANLPGVQSVAAADQLPLASWGGTASWFGVVGRPERGDHNEASNRTVTSAYFTTLGAHLLRGREFTPFDESAKLPIAIVNETLAKQLFPHQDPIGQQIFYVTPPKTPLQIVGVVADIKEGSLEMPARPAIYVPFGHTPVSSFALALRTGPTSQALFAALASRIHRIDPTIAIHDEISMTDHIHTLPFAYLHRSSAFLVGGFAAIALFLSIIGLYGVIAYSVAQRTREIGVRMSLGAQPKSIYQLILGEGARLAAMGTLLGLLCSLAAATLMRRFLFGVHSWDVANLAAVAAVILLSALLASYIPAHRAASLNPVEALRTE